MTDLQENYLTLIKNRLKLIEVALEEPVEGYHVEIAQDGVKQALKYLQQLTESL